MRTSLTSDCGDLLAAAQAGRSCPRRRALPAAPSSTGFTSPRRPTSITGSMANGSASGSSPAKALEALATAATAAGDAAAAADAWRRRSELDPLDPRSAPGISRRCWRRDVAPRDAVRPEIRGAGEGRNSTRRPTGRCATSSTGFARRAARGPVPPIGARPPATSATQYRCPRGSNTSVARDRGDPLLPRERSSGSRGAARPACSAGRW